jgi:DNA-binding MarR family transcriptional regulator
LHKEGLRMDLKDVIQNDEEKLLDFIRTAAPNGEVTLRSVSEAIGMSTNQVNSTARKLEDKALIKIKKNEYGRIRGFDILKKKVQ